MQVTVSDGEMEDVGQLILEITDENEAPVFGRDSYNVYGNEGKVCYHFSEICLQVCNATAYLILLNWEILHLFIKSRFI